MIALYVATLDLYGIAVAVPLSGERTRLHGAPFTLDWRAPRGLAVRSHAVFARADHARLVLARCRADLRRAGARIDRAGWVAAPHDEVAAALQGAARAVGAPHASPDDVARNAREAVSVVLARIEIMRRAGDLAAINAGYRAYRLQATARGVRIVSYAAFVRALARRAVARLAIEARRNPAGAFGAVICDAGEIVAATLARPE